MLMVFQNSKGFTNEKIILPFFYSIDNKRDYISRQTKRLEKGVCLLTPNRNEKEV